MIEEGFEDDAAFRGLANGDRERLSIGGAKGDLESVIISVLIVVGVRRSCGFIGDANGG